MEKHKHSGHGASEHKHYSHKNNKKGIKKVTIWKASTAVLGVLLILSIFMGGFGKGSAGSSLSGQTVADNTVKFINQNLLQGQGTAKLEGIEESNGMYKIKLDISGEKMESYVSTDGKMLFPQAIDLTAKPQLEQQPGAQALDVDIDIANSASKGADDAKVVMVEYSSFSCGYCKKVRTTIDQILTNYPNDVKMVYKHFNRGGTDSKTAQAAECSGDQDKFWEMHDLIFDKGSQGDLVGYAQEIGIDVDKFSECLDSGKYSAKVTADTNEARSFGIGGTPGFMINGRLVSGAQPYENFKQIIDEELGLKPKTASTQPKKTEPVASNVPKSDKPNVELFVMSHCPYGTQMEKGIIPVAKELGNNIDFEIKFVNYAMHPSKGEVEEQLNQYCIQKEFKDKYLAYLSKFLEAGSSADAFKAVGLSESDIATCVEETDNQFDVIKNLEDKSSWSSGRFPKFMIHDADNLKYGVRGSPTLVINGQQAQSGRDSQSILNAICGAFSDSPEECNTDMASFGTPAPGFGFGTQGGSATAAGCGA
jgi:protein-disulfide isomerase